MINRSSKPSGKGSGGFEGSPGILKKSNLKQHDDFLPQLTSPRAADSYHHSNPMPQGQVNIKMARDESRRLRKAPAVAKNTSPPANRLKKAPVKVEHPSSSPVRTKAKASKPGPNDSIISKEGRQAKLKRAQQQAAVGSTYGAIGNIKTPKN